MEYKYINTEYLENVAGGDLEMIREIVDMFREQSDEAYGQMLSLLESGDYNNLGLLAHKVKSSVAIMGMSDLASMLKKFELDAREGKDTASYKSYIQRYREETTLAIHELEDMVENYLK
ncbi:MAG TPA: Hpt domain-containing protein [Bacteroidales bacterium]|jgi:HPt (histidine-containing phosphotransfer) domain-containing protein|nr:Hpt domain-containing protein [Bacteroidales bacterium]